jgi:glycosyltransferase involved in cell wall biosynthesis
MNVSPLVTHQVPADATRVEAPRALRIAFVSYEYPPCTEGGAGAYAGELTRELVALGHSVTVFAPNRGQSYRDGSLVPVGTLGARAAGFWTALPAALRQAAHRTGSFDIIHGNAIADLTLPCRVFPAARVVTLHHLNRCIPLPGLSGLRHRLHDLRGETGFGPLFEGIVLRRANRVICVSETVKDDVIRLCGLHPSRIAVVPNGLPVLAIPDPALVASLRRAYQPQGGALLLVVGRMEHRKGTSTLLEAFARLLDDRPTHLVLAGNGSIEQYRALARRLGIEDRVHFTGHVTDEVRNALYAACDVFVSAALHEGFGLTVFEAMAMGKPVVVTDTGAAKAGWVSKEHGAVVPPGEVISLRDAMAELLASPLKRQAIGRSNSAYAGGWATWHVVAVETQRIYREAIADRLCAGERLEVAG